MLHPGSPKIRPTEGPYYGMGSFQIRTFGDVLWYLSYTGMFGDDETHFTKPKFVFEFKISISWTIGHCPPLHTMLEKFSNAPSVGVQLGQVIR